MINYNDIITVGNPLTLSFNLISNYKDVGLYPNNRDRAYTTHYFIGITRSRFDSKGYKWVAEIEPCIIKDNKLNYEYIEIESFIQHGWRSIYRGSIKRRLINKLLSNIMDSSRRGDTYCLGFNSTSNYCGVFETISDFKKALRYINYKDNI